MTETRELERDLRKGLKVSKEDAKKGSRLGKVLKGKNLIENLGENDAVILSNRHKLL